MSEGNLFLFLMFLCAGAVRSQIFEEDLVPKTCDEEDNSSDIMPEVLYADVFEVHNGTEILIQSDLLPDSNITDINDELKITKCVGDGPLDFIQCVIESKIESFRQDPSKVAFPETRPGVFQPHNKNTKIQGSLEEWIKKFNKDTVPDTNSTTDESSIHDEFKSTKCVGDGPLDFIQCVMESKIESFRQDPSKVAFPETRPGAFQPHNKNTKIQSSLEEWIKKFNKDTVPDTNSTSDE